MTTATKTAITVEFYAGNLFANGADTDGVNIPATIADYQSRVQDALPEYEITWRTHDGEGPAERIYPDNGDFENEEEINSDFMHASGEVFNDGHFWTMN